jgi:aminoglycoside phosphotransferase (APT) family kinase protein
VTNIDEPAARPRVSTRDRAEQRRQLADWIDRRLPGAEISELTAPPTNGLSSDTLLFDVTWQVGDDARSMACVARVEPDTSAVPVFPTYDMERQFRVMRMVEEHTSVPVPKTLWYEPDLAVMGSTFFVMERIVGEVPPDLMPYVFGSWLSEASAADCNRLQCTTIEALARLHELDDSGPAAFLALPAPGGTPLRRHVADQRAYYEWVVAGKRRSPLIERAFAWLEDHWPTDEGPAGLSWGDARVGNIMYRDFEPVAVLDWEMAALGPREIDLAWMIFLHRFFQDLAEQAGLPGMPSFLRRDDVAETYARASGHDPRDLDFYTLYAALRHAIVMTRVTYRQVHFGESQLPEDPDDMILHRPTLEAMLAGSYWPNIR